MTKQTKDVNVFFGFFEKLVKMVKNYGKGNIMFSIMCFFFIVQIVTGSLNVSKIADVIIGKTEQKHEDGIKQREKANLAIPYILENLVLATGADRAMILEFHNGGSNASNLPFYHFSSTYEYYRPGTQSIKYQYQNQDTGEYYQTIKMLTDNSWIYYEDIDNLQNKHYIHVNGAETPTIIKMRHNDVRCAYMVKIMDSKSKMVAILTLTSERPNGISVKARDLVDNKKVEIGMLLSGVE